jgi:hypothetical protein
VADIDEQPLIGAECGREPREDEYAADEWRAYRDISDELAVFFPECVSREWVSATVSATVAVLRNEDLVRFSRA